jgi:hypothetical protein
VSSAEETGARVLVQLVATGGNLPAQPAALPMAWIGGLIYQRAIMRTGERVRLRQVLGRGAAVSR